MTTTGSAAQTLDASWSSRVVSVRTEAEQLVSTAYERSALTLEQYAEKVVAYAESPDQVARRAAAARRVAILRDAWGPLLRAALENWTTPETLKQVLGDKKDHLDLSDNPAKRIWSELAVLYKAPPRRETRKSNKNAERFGELNGPMYDLFWKVVEKLVQTCNEVLIWPTVVERDGEKQLQHRYATPDAFTLVYPHGGRDRPECILLHDTFTSLDGEQHKQYILWTDEWHATFERQTYQNGTTELVRVDEIPPASDESEEDDSGASNPYGRLIHHIVRRVDWQDIDLDSTSGEDLVDGTLRGGEGRQFFRYNQKMHGYKMLVSSGNVDDQAVSQQQLGPAFWIRVPGDSVSSTVVDWQIDQLSAQEVGERDELRLAASRGIGPERYKHKSYASGIGAKQAERPLSELRVEMAPIMLVAERAEYKNSALVCEKHGVEDTHDGEDILDVKFAPIQNVEDPREQIEVEKTEVSLGLETPITLLMRRQPELTYEQAKKRLEDNMEDIAWFNDMKVKHNIPGDPTKESASAEANGAQGPVVRDGKPTPPGSRPGEAPPAGNSDKE